MGVVTRFLLVYGSTFVVGGALLTWLRSRRT
jgi:hypothetical protein